MDPFRATGLPCQRSLERVAVIRLGVISTLLESNSPPVSDIDSGQQHESHHRDPIERVPPAAIGFDTKPNDSEASRQSHRAASCRIASEASISPTEAICRPALERHVARRKDRSDRPRWQAALEGARLRSIRAW